MDDVHRLDAEARAALSYFVESRPTHSREKSELLSILSLAIRRMRSSPEARRQGLDSLAVMGRCEPVGQKVTFRSTAKERILRRFVL